MEEHRDASDDDDITPPEAGTPWQPMSRSSFRSWRAESCEDKTWRDKPWRTI